MNLCRYRHQWGMSGVRKRWGRCGSVGGSKVRADWIKGGIEDTCEANSNQLILF